MLAEDASMADEIQPEIDALISKLTTLNKQSIHPDDKKNAIIELQNGVGGDESALFVADLYKMYEAFAANNKLHIEQLELTPGNAGGFKNLVFSVSGRNAYGIFKNESGAHRVQRVPATETKGRVHTSIASVIVLPEQTAESVDVKKSDVKVETYNSGGKGGQHSNKSDNAVKLTHLPTGITACSQLKSQIQNHKLAWKTLLTKIHDELEQRQQTESADKKRKLRGSGMRNERIRTYNFPQDRVTDHRIKKSYSLTSIMGGDMSKLVEDMQSLLEE